MTPRKRVVEQWGDCFNRQDWRGMLALMTDDIERHEVGAPGRTRGKESFERNMRPGPDVASMRSTISRLTEEGDVVVAEGSVVLTKKDGSSMNILFCDIFEFEGDKIRRQTSYAGVEPATP